MSLQFDLIFGSLSPTVRIKQKYCIINTTTLPVIVNLAGSAALCLQQR